MSADMTDPKRVGLDGFGLIGAPVLDANPVDVYPVHLDL